MPSKSEAQRRWAGAILGGELPLPPKMTREQVKDFARKPKEKLPERKGGKR